MKGGKLQRGETRMSQICTKFLTAKDAKRPKGRGNGMNRKNGREWDQPLKIEKLTTKTEPRGGWNGWWMMDGGCGGGEEVGREKLLA
jgi:hypothetical protein